MLAEAALRLIHTDRQQARRQAEAVLAAARGAHDLVAAAQAERTLGMVARIEHDAVSAAAHLATAARLAERGGATGLAADARISRAVALAYEGRMAAAHRELDRAGALPGVDEGRLGFQRAVVLQIQGRHEEAEARYVQAQAPLSQGEEWQTLGMLYNNLGMIRYRTGSLGKAEGDLRRAVALFRQLGHSTAVTEAMHNRGLVEAKRGNVLAALATFDEVDRQLEATQPVDPVGLLDRSQVLLAARLLAEARTTAERAVREQERSGLSAYLAEARLVLARVALCEGRYADARNLAEESAREFRSQRRPSYRALADEVRIHAEWLAGTRTPGLLAASRQVAADLARSGWTVPAADARLIAAQVALALGKRALARAQLAGLTQVRRTDSAEIRSRAFHARAVLCLAGGDRRRAAAALAAGVNVFERHRRELRGTELRAHASAHATELRTIGLRLALDSGDIGRILRWAERWRARALEVRAIRPPEDTALADALAELRAVALLRPEPGPATAAAQLTRRQAALEATVRRLARVAPTIDRYEQKAATVAQIRDALDGRALLEFIDADGDLHSVILTERRRELYHIGKTASVTRLVVTLRYWMRRLLGRQGSPEALDRVVQEISATAKELDNTLLGSASGWLADRPLLLAPTARLHALPWHVLPTCAGRPVSVVPSASWWTHAGDQSRRPGPERVVLVAGPDLPHGSIEIDKLAALYPQARRLTGDDATSTAVAAALDGADLAHIAAHGRFRSDQPLLSSLRLADGPLTVYDLESLQAAPRVVILACCDGGLSNVLPGDELMGFAACLLAQGTVSLIAPVLPVPDEDAQAVMLALHRRLRTGEEPCVALAGTGSELPEQSRSTAQAFACIGR
ncbi:MAG: CHAT domain-containing protein [Catenulispora sp.]